MRLRPLCAVVLTFLLVPTIAQAHDHRWDFAMAAAKATGSSLWGGRFSLGLTNKVPTNRDLSWLIDVTNVKGDDNTQDIIQNSYLVGVRYALPGISNDYVAVMLHGIGGGVYKQTGTDGNLRGALAAGVAVEWVPRGTPDGWAVRGQIERSFVKDASNYTQFSFGAVKRFN